MEAEKIYALIASYLNGHFQLMINGRNFMFYYVLPQTLLLTGVLQMDLSKWLIYTSRIVN